LARSRYSPTCVDPDFITDVDKERDLDFRARLNDGGLCDVRRRIASDTRFGLRDDELDEGRRLDTKDLALIGENGARHVLLDKFEIVAEQAAVYGFKLVGFHVHEIVQVAVVVAVLHFTALDIRGFKFIRRAKGGLSDGASEHVPHLRPYERCAFTRLDMLKLNDLHDLAVPFEGYAVSEITC